MSAAVAVAVGTVFGFGLAVSGMINPAKVLAFLDVTGDWDPSLALVMGGALAVTAPLYAWSRRRRQSLLGESLRWPARRDVDARLLTGSTLFGVGWGLSGFCPGPALAALAAPDRSIALFAVALVAGTLAAQLFASSTPEPGGVAGEGRSA